MREGVVKRSSGVIATLILLACAVPAWAKLPDWAETIAASAPDLPDGVTKETSRFLLSEIRYAIQPDGRLVVRRRLAIQALRADSQWKLGQGSFYFNSTMKMKTARAWHLAPQERARRNWEPPVDVTVGDEFLSDSMARVVAVERVRKGSLVFFEFEGLDNPYFMDLWHLFYEDGPIVLARMEVEAPADWTLRAIWLRGAGPEPAVHGGIRTWEMRDLPAPGREPLGPDPKDQAPLLAVQAVPGEAATSRPATFVNWTAVSNWYGHLIEGRDGDAPAIAAAASRAFADTGAGFFDRVKAAGTFVRDHVRYVAIELGIGGWQPHAAAETLEHLYGDCKDKGTLFRAMLATAGIPSFPVLVNLTSSRTVSRELPVFWFNHFIVAVPLPPDLDVPPAYEGAVADGGELGRLLLVDTTDERVSIGSLSAELAGKTALVAAGERGRLIELPQNVSAHRVERRLRVEIGADRSLAIARASRYLGAFAAAARTDYLDSAEDREDFVRARIDTVWTGAEMKGYGVEPETDDGSFMETATVYLPPPSGPEQNLTIELFAGAALDVPRVPLARRTQVVDYGYPRTIRYEIIVRKVPTDAPLPEAREEKGSGWSISTSFERKGEGVVARWETTMSKVRFEPTEFPELRRYWSAVTGTASETLTLPPRAVSATR